MAPNVEFRMAAAALGSEHGALSYQRLAPGFRLPFGHRHARQEEIYVVVGGGGRMKVEDDVVELERWTAVRVAPGTVRAVEAGVDGVELLIFGAPRTGPGDAEMVAGWWTD